MSTSALLALAACGGSGGDDDSETCGPAGAPADGITASVDGASLTYGGFVAGPNNDCPDPDDPSAPTSLTIVGAQTGEAFPLTLCVRRPDRWADAPAALGTAVVVEDVSASVDGCTLRFDRQGAAPTGTATAAGLCSLGTDAAGFAMTLSGEVSVIRTCGSVETPLRLTLSGTAAVAAQ